MRTFGVEEEPLLVDEETGRPVPAAPRALAAGDDDLALAVVSTILEDGTGADRQRAAALPEFSEAVRHAVLVTHASPIAVADRFDRWLPCVLGVEMDQSGAPIVVAIGDHGRLGRDGRAGGLRAEERVDVGTSEPRRGDPGLQTDRVVRHEP